MAELGCRQCQPSVEIHHLSALHHSSRLHSLFLPVFTQHPFVHLIDGERRHHQGTFIGYQGQEVLGLPTIG
jgi:hypothetical protein